MPRKLVALLGLLLGLAAGPTLAQTIPTYTFGTLPGSPTAGQLAWITDGGATPIPGTAEIGGGTHKDLVAYDATQLRWEFVQRAPDDLPPEELPTFLSAPRISYDNSESGAAADDVQEALDELFAGGGGGGGGGGDNLGNGQATTDLDMNGNDVIEVDGVAMKGDFRLDHFADRRTYASPAHARAIRLRSPFTIDGIKDGATDQKTSTVGFESEFWNLTSSQAFNAWLETIGGGDSDLVGLELRNFHTGPCADLGDECNQNIRAQVSDVYFTGTGSFSGSLPSGAATTVLTIPANAMSETSSKVAGEDKPLVLEAHPSAANVTIVDAPPATMVGGVEEAGWTGTGTGPGEGVWTLGAGQVPANPVGWCFSANAANYTDLAGTTSRHWLYITAGSPGGPTPTITTEWNAQGVNQRIPRGYAASIGTNAGRIAPCPKIVDVDLGTDYVADTITVSTGAGFPGASAQAFTLGSYGLHTLNGARFLIENKLGSVVPASGVVVLNRLETNRSRYQGGSAFDATYVGDLANLLKGQHAWSQGVNCGKPGACEAGIDFDYSDAAGVQEWLAEINVSAARWTTTPETLTVVRTAKDQTKNLTLHPILGWGQFGDPFARTSQLNTPNGSGPTTSSSGRLVEWSQIEGMPAGFADGSDDGSSGGATDLNGLTDVTLATPAVGAGLVWNGTQWVNGPLDLADADARTGVLPDANVSDTITASNYMPTAGGSFTGPVSLLFGASLTVGNGSSIFPLAGGIVQANQFAASGSTSSAVDLPTAEVSGILGAGNGGLGISNPTSGGILLGTGPLAVHATPVLTAGQLLIGDGTTDPTIAAMSGDATMTSGGVVSLSTGSVDANEIVSTGVAAGTYQSPSLTIDPDGRVTAASQGTNLLIGSGTKALSTTTILSGGCNTDTITAAGVLSTDVVAWSPNGDLSAVNGFRPVSPDGLAIYPPVPSSGSITVKTCNPTGASITPGAVSINWRVTR